MQMINAPLDIGFRVLKITDSVFEPINETQTRIRDFCDEQAACFEVMTRAGIDLAAPVDQVMLNCGKCVWRAGNVERTPGSPAQGEPPPPDATRPERLLIACFERTLRDVDPRTLALDIARLAAPGATLFAFMDSAFGPPQDPGQARHAPKQRVLEYLRRNDVNDILTL